MKKIFIIMLCLVLLPCFSACKAKEKQIAEETQSDDELIVYDLMEKFYSNPKNVNCVASDHALVIDNLYDLIGVVQYTDADNNPSCLAFISQEECKNIKLTENGEMYPANGSKLIYLGDGCVSFMMQEENSNKLYEYTVTYSLKDGESAIKTESKLIED